MAEPTFIEIVRTVEALDGRARSNTHRIDALEKVTEEIHEQGKALAVMCEQLRQQGKELSEQGKRLKALEDRPAAQWNTVVTALITTGVGIVLGYLLGMPVM